MGITQDVGKVVIEAIKVRRPLQMAKLEVPSTSPSIYMYIQMNWTPDMSGHLLHVY